MAIQSDDDLLDYKQVAAKMGIGVDAVQKLVKRRAIPVIKLNARLYRFNWPQVQAALAKLTVKAVG